MIYYESIMKMLINTNRKILINILKTMVNNPFKEFFYGKRKRKIINDNCNDSIINDTQLLISIIIFKFRNKIENIEIY